MISQLRDIRKCKVILILNEDSLNTEEKQQFQEYSEKVIDRVIRFLPTETEAAAIAFPEKDAVGTCLRSYCEQLGIKNIRIMLKVKSIAKELIEAIEVNDNEARDYILKSLVILTWAYLSSPSEGAPSVDYLKNHRLRLYAGDSRQKVTPQEAEWNALLDEYGFTHCDALELTILKGIDQGFFNTDQMAEETAKVLRNTVKIRAEAALEAAWAPLHDSFDDNSDDVAKSIYRGCVENITSLTPMNLSGAVEVLKGCGHLEKAQRLIEEYTSFHADAESINLPNYVFADYVKDIDVIQALSARTHRKTIKKTSLVEAAAQIATGSWSQEDEETLSLANSTRTQARV